MEHYSVTFLPDNRTVRIHSGATLFEAAGQADIVLVSPCGGRGTCKKCRVRLEPSGREVLACQHHVTENLTVTISNQSRLYKHQILEDAIEKKIQVNSLWRKIFLADCPESAEQLYDILSNQYYIAVRENPTLKPFSRHHPAGITVVLHYYSSEKCWRIKAIEPGKTIHKLYGAAADIGTTTVVMRLADLVSGKIAATASAANPQHQWGDDVISRIEYASTHEGQQMLNQTIIGCLNDLLRQAAADARISTDDIYELVAVGNTTMNHLLMKYPVTQLGQSPYSPHALNAVDTPTENFHLLLNPAGSLHTPQNIAGFVGSDTLAAAVSAELDTEHHTSLLVDIGTNGEIVLCHEGKLYAASCAAGPALEGARIHHGSRAMQGAIQQVIYNDADMDMDIDVIGAGKPHSICGSGLIDAMAVLLQAGIIDSTGKFREKDQLLKTLPVKLYSRLMEYETHAAFVFAYDTNGKPAVFLTQRDIRQLQLAKAAIRAGIRVLEKTAGIDHNRIEKILLAGAFGNYIQKSSAVQIGLLPTVPLEKIHFIGNAASSGALEILLDKSVRAKCEKLARRMEYIELAVRPDFQDIFAECLMF